MRPPRVIIAGAFLLTTFFLTFFSLRSSHQPQTIVGSSTVPPKSGIQSLFSFRAPFSLFPPNAIITLTHENSTAFLARPAAFGPLLPSEGLKGQLWIGSGFGDDSIRQGSVSAAAEGELGCSDVPGWVDSGKAGAAAPDGDKSTDDKATKSATKSPKVQRRSDESDDRTAASEDNAQSGKGSAAPSVDDGTDDYLHHPLPGSTVMKSTGKQHVDSNGDHADIQSIQEGAEIQGKVVLLSRGGCGFLEKVKWAQRRGAIALIVGDDTKGGPLIQMYARGDTSNVTIPSIFTSRTTAHLLSSLIGEGSFLEDSLDEDGKPTLKVQHTDKIKKPGKKINAGPTFTPTEAATKATGTARGSPKSSNKKPSARDARMEASKNSESRGWFMSLFFGSGKAHSKTETSRPPSSGQLDWVLVDDWKDDDSSGSKKISTKPKINTETEKQPSQNAKSSTKQPSSDDFVIGVQDWRDPDLIGSSGSTNSENSGKATTAKADGKLAAAPQAKNEASVPLKAGGKKHIGGALQEIPDYIPPLRGGSITPGSGEYDTNNSPLNEKHKEKVAQEETSKTKGKSLLTAIFGDDEEDVEFLMPGYSADHNEEEFEDGDEDGEIEGLWVTITPTSGASPFLDTLLVLVVSPLVTLTVVYALLLVRSRIRRRRWRAPKSVVERLPVRTYQTIATPGSQSPRLASPTTSSVTTPLLQHSPSSRPRPRSRTTTGIPEHGDLIRANSGPLQVPAITSRNLEHEKPQGSESSSGEWKRFMGKQVECVVCLEEYVDGVSRVMSLPCGHEFHVDCITPWLTTRRRTCPICKGDVVRSLARGSPTSPRYEAYHDDSESDIQAEAAETVNTSSSSALPISGAVPFSDDDIEQGTGSPHRPQRSQRTGSWRSMFSRSPRQMPEDRDR